MKKKEKKFFYPDTNECIYKTFQIKYNGQLSPTLILLLKSFQKKYFYHVMDDILYLLNLRLEDRDLISTFLISPALVLQNHFCIDFLEIWVCDIFINEVSKPNRFLKVKTKNVSYITIKFLYRAKLSSYKKKDL